MVMYVAIGFAILFVISYRNAQIDELISIDEFGEITAESVYNFFHTEKSVEEVDKLLEVDKKRWAAEAEEITAYYAENFGDKMPKEIMENLEILKKNCAE